MRQEEADGQEAGEGVGDALTGDVRGGPVDRLEHGHPRRLGAVDVGAGGHAQAPLERGPQVRHDVTEEVVGDDHPEAGRILDQEQAQGVDIDMLALDGGGVLPGDLVEDTEPQLVGVAHGVGFIRHVHRVVAVNPGVLEGRTDDALDALARVDVLVDRHLVRGAPLELAPHADVDALGVLAEDDEVHVASAAPLEGDEAVGERTTGAHVGEEVVTLAHAEDDVPRMLHARHPRIAQGPEEDRRALPLDRHADLRWEGGAIPQVTVRAQVQLPEVERQATLLAHQLEEQLALPDHLGADPVASDQGDLGCLHFRTRSRATYSSLWASATGP